MRTLTKITLGLAAVSFFIILAMAGPDEKVPEMKFNEVKEIAPGVFFRYSSISIDPKVPFGGSNETWIVFKDYVVVVDANFPKEAADIIADIKKTTDKPIKYVLDTHHHGDHAYGNSVWAKEGAKIVSQTNCARLLKANGPAQWEQAKKDREDLRTSELKQVDIPFDEKYVLEDETQRVEFLFLGHAHTPGDAVAYLPKHKILCTGDACVNGAFNFMGHSNSGSWIHVLEKMEKLDVKLVCPGHGPLAGKEVLDKQKRYFTDMRSQIKAEIDSGKKLDDVKLSMAWYKDWTGKDANAIADNIKHVYSELTGKIDYDKLGRANDGDAPWSYARETKTPATTVPTATTRRSE